MTFIRRKITTICLQSFDLLDLKKHLLNILIAIKNTFRLKPKLPEMTKLVTVFILPLILFFASANAQNKVEKITAKDGIHYITTTIDYPITGTYLFEGQKEPITQLNLDGTGIFQLLDLSKTTIIWGIECFENGTPKYEKGFNYAVYTLWYKNKETNSEIETPEDWTNAHFSIHFQKKKMFILGERSKDYVD